MVTLLFFSFIDIDHQQYTTVTIKYYETITATRKCVPRIHGSLKSHRTYDFSPPCSRLLCVANPNPWCRRHSSSSLWILGQRATLWGWLASLACKLHASQSCSSPPEPVGRIWDQHVARHCFRVLQPLSRQGVTRFRRCSLPATIRAQGVPTRLRLADGVEEAVAQLLLR